MSANGPSAEASTRDKPRANNGPGGQRAPADPGVVRTSPALPSPAPEPDSASPPEAAAPAAIAQIIARVGARQKPDLQALAGEFRQRLDHTEYERETAIAQQDGAGNQGHAVSPMVQTSPSSDAPRDLSPKRPRLLERRRARWLSLMALVLLLAILSLVALWLLQRPDQRVASTPMSAAASAVTVAAPASTGTALTSTSTPSGATGLSAPITVTPPDQGHAQTAARPTSTPPAATPTTSAVIVAGAGAPVAARAVPGANPRTATNVRQQVADAEAGLRTGLFEATIDYGNNNRSVVRVRFDYGDRQRTGRLHITMTTQKAGGAQTTEYLLVDDRSWQRQPNGPWVEGVLRDGMWEQVEVFLPRANAAANASLATTTAANSVALRWYDGDGNADTVLQVDADTGIPQQLRQVPRGSGPTLTVVYRDWNKPIDIRSPSDS